MHVIVSELGIQPREPIVVRIQNLTLMHVSELGIQPREPIVVQIQNLTLVSGQCCACQKVNHQLLKSNLCVQKI
jgi:hypothetical protein